MSAELNKPVAYSLHVDDELLNTTKKKLQLARYPEELEDVADDDWSSGSTVKDVRRLADYWKNGYDWRAEEAAINREYDSFKVRVDVPGYGPQVIHYAHQRSSRENAIPLLIVHGWPGSFLESRKLIKPLTEPSSPTAQPFHLIIPSLPGFGPGDAPTKSGFGVVRTARAFKKVIVDILGYKLFVAQAGDWGAMVVRSMAMQYPEHVRACHHNFVPCGPPPWYKAPLISGRLLLSSYLYSAREKNALKQLKFFFDDQFGYYKQQATKPQSLGFALGDSPLGLLGWLVEKYHVWTDAKNYTMPDDELLGFLMMHWMPGVTPGLRFYKAAPSEQESSSSTKCWTVYHDTPVGISCFPKEVSAPPRDWVAHVANVQYWNEHTTGGHFPHVECPDKLVDDLRDFFTMDVVKSAMREQPK